MKIACEIMVLTWFLATAYVDSDRPTFKQCVDKADFVVQADFVRLSPMSEHLAATLRDENPFPKSLEFALAEFSTNCCIKGNSFPDSVSLPVLVRRADGEPMAENVSWELVLEKDNIGLRLSDRVASVPCSYIICVKRIEYARDLKGGNMRYKLVSSGLYQQQSVRACVELF